MYFNRKCKNIQSRIYKIKCNDWLLADKQSLRFILSLRMKSSFITSRPALSVATQQHRGGPQMWMISLHLHAHDDDDDDDDSPTE